jgi:signal peptidase
VNLVGLLLSLKLLVVLSASMGSALPVGSLALVAPREEYFVGDIVTFKIPNSEELLTHRIVEICETCEPNGISVIRTQGDANNVADDWEITNADIVGKIVFHIPYLGYLFYLPQTVLTKVF